MNDNNYFSENSETASLSPVIVTVYDRLDLLHECIEHLKKNAESKETVLYISSDAPRLLNQFEKIEKVRDYIKSIKGFKEVIPLLHNTNLGGHNAVLTTIDYVLKTNPKFILLEDDIQVSEHFLSYMNRCLKEFESNTDISFICSYLWPNFRFDNFYKEDIFFWKGFCPWGMATWKNKWEEIDFDLKKFDYFFESKNNIKEFNKIDPNTFWILLSDLSGEVVATDARICLNLYLQNKYSVFPSKTLCVNRGHDGRGVNESKNSIYMKQKLTNFNPVMPSNTEYLPSVQEFIHKFHYRFLKHKIYLPLLRFKLFKIIKSYLKKIFKP